MSRLDYCNSLYFGVDQCLLHRLQLVQNAAARLLTGIRRYDHIAHVLASLHWLPVVFRIKLEIQLFAFKSLHGLAPQYMSLRTAQSIDQFKTLLKTHIFALAFNTN